MKKTFIGKFSRLIYLLPLIVIAVTLSNTATARETRVLEEKLVTTEAQLQQALLDIDDMDTDYEGVPDTGDSLLVPSAIIGLGIIIAAILLVQKDRL